MINWCKNNRDMAIEFLRIYLGLMMLIKGIQFMMNPDYAKTYMNMVSIPFFDFLSIHIVAMVHIAGGILLILGLISRVAALIQIPIVLGAIFFVHLQQGLFNKSQDLEYVILVFILLLIFTIYGGGRLSIDNAIDNKSNN